MEFLKNVGQGALTVIGVTAGAALGTAGVQLYNERKAAQALKQPQQPSALERSPQNDVMEKVEKVVPTKL